MKMTVYENTLKAAFESYNRDYYSWDGCKALLEYYDEIDENMELDVIAICCDCTEYGSHGAVCSFDDLVSDYGYKLPYNEWFADNEYPEDLYNADTVKEEYLEELVKTLEDSTTVLHCDNGNYIVFVF